MSTTEAENNVNSNLQKQDISQLDVSKLTPLSPEVISRQATINIGTIGHVAHGKSTVVKAISGVQTVRFKNELERNITIKLERVPYSILIELTRSPQKLREFIQTGKRRYSTKDESSYNLLNGERALDEIRKKEKICQFVKNDFVLLPPPPMAMKRRSYDYEENLITRDLNYSDAESVVSATSSRKSDDDWSEFALNHNYDNICWQDIWEMRFVELPSKDRKKNHKNPEEYVVEYIEDINEQQNKPVFNVKWRGYSSSENTWEPLENIQSCSKFMAYVEQNVRKYQNDMNIIFKKILNELKQESRRIQTNDISVAEAESYNCIAHILDIMLLAVFRLSGYKNKNKEKIIIDRIKQQIHIIPYFHKRRDQLLDLMLWKKLINNIEPSLKIEIENVVDFDHLPKNFYYIKKNIAGKNVVIPEDPPIGCNCVDGCSSRSDCCANMSGMEFAYSSKRKLRVPPRTPIFECNKRCSCGIDCRNRIVQNGLKDSLTIFKTTNRGWGVKAKRIISPGDFVCEYVGEVITNVEAERRGKICDAQGLTYLFDLDFNEDSDSIYSIDAANYGNISHFVNHSCEPNCSVWPVWVDCLDPNLPRLAIFSLKRIEAGEELTFDYTNQDNCMRQFEHNLMENEEKKEINPLKIQCLCGAQKCRKYLF